MKTVKYVILLSLIALIINSCKKEKGLSDEEIAEGLKSALVVGTDSSSTKLHKTDGYFGDALVKILLPPDAHGVIDHQNDPWVISLGLDKKIDTLILSLNRSAEDAAIEAKPIFVDAITSITITDAKGILYGTDSAATVYLKIKTFTSLFNVFMPKVKNSLDKPLVGGTSANEAWQELINLYNPLCGGITGWLPITTVTLDTFATNKGLDGLFLKISDEEKSIRKDPAARVNDILKRVFGELD